MRKISLVVIFAICCILLCGCSSNASSFKREHDKKDDVIKFNNIDWLTSKEDVDAKLKEDFGDEFITIIADLYRKANDEIGFYQYTYKAKDGGNLNWNIGGYENSIVAFTYASDDKSKTNYLVSVTLKYADFTEEMVKDLRSKLRKIYNETETDDKKHHIGSTFTDSNNNTIYLKYWEEYDDQWGHNDALFYIDYICGDMEEYFNQLREEYDRKQNKEEANGL